MKKIFTTGTFDLLHYGHINLLKTARNLGDYLIVGVNVNPANKQTFYSYENRKAILESIKYVDQVVPIYEQEDKYKYLEEENIDTFAIGDDYIGYSDIPQIEKYCPVVYIKRTPDISTTKIKEHLKSDNTKYNTFVIDIDDTICYVKDRDFKNAIPNNIVINKINKLYDSGWTIILFTARGAKSCKTLADRIEKYKKVTEDWLKDNNVKYTELIFGKMNADYYIDDKNMSIDEFLNF